ncbi:Protein RBL [Striga hermonthica]|uniref:Protein RBL n=1 Tax=Striga hermonthica TaxID=68872 RepID=A0A9N7NGN7_STRHE|nr:Protein RBL [Striga hermonthica]
MNAPIIDPLQGDFPEVIEEYLEHGIMKCIAFNRRGTLLAAGCSDGSCVVWDFETRGIAKVLKDKDLIAAITSVCWSKYGHCILVSAADKSLTLWDVVKGEKIARTTIQQMPLQARLHPGSSTPSICLACPFSSAPLIVDLRTSISTVLPVSLSDTGIGYGNVNGNGNGNGALSSRNKFSDGSPAFSPTAACFNKRGDLVYVGNFKGEILIVDHNSMKIRAFVPIAGSGVIKNISFSRNGQYLLTNSNDRTIRIYENLLPVKGGLQALDELSKQLVEQDEIEKLKGVGSRCLALFREFQDSVTRVHWKAPCFSGDGEWVVGGSANKGEHKMYIWDRAGHLVKILEGPKEALIDLAWHPIHPIVVSVSLTGLVYIWAKDYTENWSAFAPDFKELEENEEYVEREDEFDLVPETEKVKDSDINEDEEIDIVTVEKDSVFSDSDMSQDEIRFLSADPCADVVEQQDRHVVRISKQRDDSRSVSPFSEEAGQNGHLTNNESSPLEDDMGETHPKRKRKPSEKVVEFDADFDEKSISKNKAPGNA